MGFVHFTFSSLKLSTYLQSLGFWYDVFLWWTMLKQWHFRQKENFSTVLFLQATNKPLEKQMSSKMLYFSSSNRELFIKDYKHDNLGHLGHLFSVMRNVEEWEQWPHRKSMAKPNDSAAVGKCEVWRRKRTLYIFLFLLITTLTQCLYQPWLRWSSSAELMQLCIPGTAALAHLLSASLLLCRHQMCFCLHGRRVITSSCFKHKETEICLLVPVHRC